MRKWLIASLVSLGLLIPQVGIGKGAKRDTPQKELEWLRAEQLTKVAKTQGLLAQKISDREAEMRARVRVMYKLTRSSWPRLWFEPKARHDVAQWLGAVRRIRNRDRLELQLLQDEITVANAAQERLESSLLASASLPESLPRLAWPLKEPTVAQGFGLYKGPSHRVMLRQRGIQLASSLGEEVLSPQKGRVRYVGGISGLGTAVLIDHEGCITILGHLQSPAIAAGQQVEEGSLIARAAGNRVYMEVRLVTGDIGHVIDPILVLPR